MRGCRFLIFLFSLFLTISCTKSGTYDWIHKPFQEPITISIDKNFSQSEKWQLYLAFKTWEKESLGKITFHIKWDQPRPDSIYKNAQLNKNSGIFIWHLSKSTAQLNSKDLIRHVFSGGFTRYGPHRSAYIIIFDELYPNYFYGTALHEIGHLIGLQHTADKEDIMNPTIQGQKYLSDNDIKQLCSLYDC